MKEPTRMYKAIKSTIDQQLWLAMAELSLEELEAMHRWITHIVAPDLVYYVSKRRAELDPAAAGEAVPHA